MGYIFFSDMELSLLLSSLCSPVLSLLQGLMAGDVADSEEITSLFLEYASLDEEEEEEKNNQSESENENENENEVEQ